MAISVVMPALELTQETGKLVAWRKEEGEPVAKGEVLLEVETDKAVVEIEAAADGILAGVKAVAGDIIPVGKTNSSARRCSTRFGENCGNSAKATRAVRARRC
jgi:pyruvate dehydrogenase E2 component (dihydrolipoamide acetyltransferase)